MAPCVGLFLTETCWTAVMTYQIKSGVRLEMDALVATATWMEVALVWELSGTVLEKGWREISGAVPTRLGWTALLEEEETVTTSHQNLLKYPNTVNGLPAPTARLLSIDSLKGQKGALLYMRITLELPLGGAIQALMQKRDLPQHHHHIHLLFRTHTPHHPLLHLVLPTAALDEAPGQLPKSKLSLHLQISGPHQLIHMWVIEKIRFVHTFVLMHSGIAFSNNTVCRIRTSPTVWHLNILSR